MQNLELQLVLVIIGVCGLLILLLFLFHCYLGCTTRKRKEFPVDDEKYFEYIHALLEHQEEVDRKQAQLQKIYQSVSF